ncbi:MAG: hypothetical protein GXO35_06665 [Gammaproteobacteria bacterium]|nr:hypothetical protein [Gammaproteobacteria bacterium]
MGAKDFVSGFGDELKNMVVGSYVEDWQNGRRWRAIGRGTAFLLFFILGGVGGVVGKAGEAGGAAFRLMYSLAIHLLHLRVESKCNKIQGEKKRKCLIIICT